MAMIFSENFILTHTLTWKIKRICYNVETLVSFVLLREPLLISVPAILNFVDRKKTFLRTAIHTYSLVS